MCVLFSQVDLHSASLLQIIFNSSFSRSERAFSLDSSEDELNINHKHPCNKDEASGSPEVTEKFSCGTRLFNASSSHI